jgi:tetratricopeptide (TPR) repeat protein
MNALEKGWFWFGISFLIYANTLNHEYTIDDLVVVTSNKMTQEGVSAIPEIFKHSFLFGYDGREDESYRPLTLTTFAIEKSLFDAKPGTSHLIQVILYGLCILVLFKFLLNLFGNHRKNIAIAITLIFMLHPIHTEVVANVKSRDELLSALFLLSALWVYSKWIINRNFRYLFVALFSFFIATLSKETAVLGVLLFPATYYYMQPSSFIEVLKKNLVFILPFLLYFGIRTLVLNDVLIQDPIDPVANSLALAQTGGDQFTSNLLIFSKYIQLSVLPIELSWDYSISTFPLVGFANPLTVFGLLFLMFLFGLFVFGIIKKDLLGFGALIFISTFALTSNFFFLINCSLGERFLFIPVLGIIMIAVLIIDKLMKNRTKAIGIILLGIFSLFFLTRTLSRNMEWKNNLLIYEAGIKVSPESVKAHFNLGTEYLEQGIKSRGVINKEAWFKKAVSELKVAKKIYPAYVNTYENMGFVYAELGKIAKLKKASIEYFEKGLSILNTAIDSLKLEKPTLYQNKFFVLQQLIALSDNKIEKEHFMHEMVRTVDQKKTKNEDDYQRQIYYLRLLNQDDELIKVSEKLIKNYPNRKGYLLELSEVFFKQQKFDKSLEIITIYVDYNPKELSAKSNKGMLLEILGSKNEALTIYKEILAVDPNQKHTRDLYDKLKRTL